MEQLKCPNCGGNVDRARMICPYCGTQFKREHDPNLLRIETYTPHMEVLGAKVMVDEQTAQLVGTETTSEIMMRELSKKIADSIAPFMEVRTSFDHKTLSYVADARVRVLRPDYRF